MRVDTAERYESQLILPKVQLVPRYASLTVTDLALALFKAWDYARIWFLMDAKLWF
jgi:hypothetical protein